jgi:hypothetical protein
MGIYYNQDGYAITENNISTVNLTNSTLSSVNNNGKYAEWSFSMQNVGCGSTGLNLIIDDSTIPFVWTKISWKTWFNFASSCWSFANTNNTYGTGNHNILSWNSSIDSISKPKNCWELPQYTLKMSTCDNNSDNFAHGGYLTGSFRNWNMVRRRDGTNSAGPAAGFACTSGGTCIISQIMVFR